MSDGKEANSAVFRQHLMALNCEFERLVIENVQLRKLCSSSPELHNFGSELHKMQSSPSNPMHSAVSGYPEASETLWTVHSLDCASSPKPPVVTDMAYLESPKHLQLPFSKGMPSPGSPSPSPGSPSPTGSQFQECDAEMGSLPGTVSEDMFKESEDNASFFLMLDIIPALVILASSIVAGISADFEPESLAWTVLETLFAIFFIGEIAVKIEVFGLKEFFLGRCVILAIIGMAITYASLASGEKQSLGAMSSLKMLKLARLGRIIRLLKFKIFQEPKLMIQGVFTGLRVLFWAVVLLIGCVYLLGVVSRTLFWDMPEFETVPRAMSTSFRCFTDGCSTYEGAPLQDLRWSCSRAV